MMFGNRRFGDSSLISRLMVGSALSALAIGAAQAQPANSSTETVVVTGTSIRGAQPTGANLITLDRSTIESTGAQTVQQLLTNIPALSGFGGSPQTNQAVPAALGIHGVGQGSSTATLVLVDGHRMPGQGVAESDPDPNLIPAIALQRVEVLPDGASAIYGSDAVSGVLNFITRKDFTGVETSVQSGFADRYQSFDAAMLWGHAWSGGSVMAAYEYSSQSQLANSARDFVTARQDIRRGANAAIFGNPTMPQCGAAAGTPSACMTVTPAAGAGTNAPYGATIPFPSPGVNFQTFFCPVATIAANSTANAFYYTPAGDYSTTQNPNGSGWSTSTTNQPSQGACDNVAVTALLPSVTSNDGLIQIRQEITNELSFDAEFVYGTHDTYAPASRGTVSAQVYGPTAATGGAGSNATTAAAAAAGEINPFFVGNSVTGTASEFVRYDFNSLLGPGAYSKNDTSALFMTSGLTYDLGSDRELVLSTVFGANTIYVKNSGQVAQAEALMALNGTTASAGVPGTNSEPDVFGLGSTLTGARILSTLNALDVWHPAGSTNRTSAQVLAALKDGGNAQTSNQGIQDVSLKFDGPLIDLPAGPLKIAAGGEFFHGYFDEYGTTNNNVGGSIGNSSYFNYRNGRQIYSAFLEVSVPLVSPEMNVPLIDKLSVDMSGRYDQYSRIGDTENPKVGVDWVLTEGIKARASYGTSFVAPNLHDSNPFNSQSQINGLTAQFSNPVILFNDTRPFNGGAGVAGTWVSTAASCQAGGGTVSNAAGVAVAATDPTAAACRVNWGAANGAGTSAAFTIPGGNGTLKPATARNYSAGVDFDFGKFIAPLDGLTLNVTYYEMAYRHLITNQQTQNNIPQLSFFAPVGGWTITSPFIQSFIAGRPLNVSVPSTIWGTFDGRLQNAFNIWENGIDFAAAYEFQTDNLGTFRVGLDGNQLLRYTTQGGDTGALLDTVDGKNSPRYPSYDLQFAAHVGWTFDAFNGQLTMNYIHPSVTTLTNYPYNLSDPTGSRAVLIGPETSAVLTSANWAHVGALITFNLNANYALSPGFLGLPEMASNGMSVSLNIQNLFNTTPPFAPNASNPIGGGSGGGLGNPVLRQVTVGLRKSW
jgi:iron complex outermembrane receptor protein